MSRCPTLCLLLMAAFLAHCGRAPDAPTTAASPEEAVDGLAAQVAANAKGLRAVATVEHARLAAKEGVPMPASVVTIVSDPAVNTALMQAQPQVGLDLPLKVLAYADGDDARVLLPQAAFLAARHGVTDEPALAAYAKRMEDVVADIDESVVTSLGDTGVERDFGIVRLTSTHDFEETKRRLRATITAQGDTVWFGEVDFQADASAEGASIAPATLFLFGGPKPGGVAMAQFPKLGLDAFCQKLLVLQVGDTVEVLFNSIVAFADFHYGRHAKPHELLDKRLRATFEKALQSDEDEGGR